MIRLKTESSLARSAMILSLALILARCAGGASVSSVAEQTIGASLSPAAASGTTSDLVRLLSPRVDVAPVVDGRMEAVWTAAEPLRIPLTWGQESTEHALDVELRALHTAEELYLLAKWAGAPPSGEQDTVFNKLTLHWRIPDSAAQKLACDVVCHTAFADGEGSIVYANAETIPQGGNEGLSAAGGWDAGWWTFEWARPLVSANPYDLQLAEADQEIDFMVKIFERVEGRPDPISDLHVFVLKP